MSVKVNSSGKSFAKKLLAEGKVNTTAGDWSFSSEDENHLLGSELDDWAAYSQVHLGIDPAEGEETKARFKYPVVKDGMLNRKGLIAAESRAAASGAKDIAELAKSLLTAMDKGCQDSSPSFRIDSVDPRIDKVRRHIDFLGGPTEWQTSPMTKLPNGSYTGKACLTNVGVFPYLGEDGKIRHELRCYEAVMDPKSLATLKGVPFCNDHPHEEVTPDNYKKYAAGSIGTEITHDQIKVYGPVTINEKQAIADFEKGKRGLSAGYDADVVFSPVTFDTFDEFTGQKTGTKSYPCPGNFLGTQYDCIQTNIVYNHTALVKEGRAGDAARLRMDSALVRQDSTQRRGDSTMRKVHLDNGLECEGDDSLVAAYLQAHQDRKDAEKELAEKDEEIEDARTDAKMKGDMCTRLEAERDALSASLKEKEKELEDAKKSMKTDEALSAEIGARLELMGTAKGLGLEVKHSDSALVMKRAILGKVTPSLKLDGKDDSYIEVAFETAMSSRTQHADSARAAQVALGSLGTTTHNDAAETAKAHAEYKKGLSTAWQTGRD